MIISRTPFRLSFFGGGTDYPAWFTEHGGAVLSTSFNKYSYISCRFLPPFFEHKYRVSYSKLEHVNSVDELEHPAIRAVLREHCPEDAVEIHCEADLPARSGLGSSSAFVVGLLNALHGLKAHRVKQDWLAHEATRIEQVVLAENVGCQDQIACAFGGMNIIRFQRDGTFRVEPLILKRERKQELNNHLMLFFTGFQRISSTVAKAKIDNLKNRQQELFRMHAMVDEAADLLCSDADIRRFGEMLHETWMIKRQLSNMVTTSAIDEIYDNARRAGALGGKLLGAGGGGFIALFVEPEKRESVLRALQSLIHVDFSFENSGSQILYYA